MLQTIGFDLLQTKLKKKDFLLDYLITTIEILDNFYDVGIITDGRLVYEIEVLKAKYPSIKTILLTNEKDNLLTEKEKKHKTETDLDSYKDFDYIVENKGIDNLLLKAEEIVGGRK